MAGYTRQSTADIQTGEDVLAAPLNAEFNAIRDAFNGSTGHEHDGTTGNGPKIDLTSSISGVLPVANGGIAAIHKLDATTAPAVGDDSGDGYGVGSVWVDTTNDKFYICVDASLGAAVWKIFQPYSAILDEYAAVDPTAAGLALLDDADASAQRTTLGLVIGTNVQAYDAGLQSISGLTTSSDKTIYTTGSDTYATTDLTSFGRSLIDDADASTARTTLGVVIGTNVQAYSANLDEYAAVNPTTAGLALLDDVDASAQRTTLGLAIGTDVQAHDADLTAIGALAKTDGNFIVGNGSTWVAESGATARDSLGLGTADSPQYTAIELGHATDTTIARASAGRIAVEGVGVLLETDVRVRLTSDRTYYVRTDGSDSNDGLTNTSGGAFLTIAKAISVVSALDLSVYNVTIQLQDTTWGEAVNVSAAWVGAGVVTLRGASNACVLNAAAALTVRFAGSKLTIRDITIGGSVTGLVASEGGAINVGENVIFAGTGIHVRTECQGSFVNFTAPYSITSGGLSHFLASPSGFINCYNLTVTLSGTLNFSFAFAAASQGGLIGANSSTFSGGTITGKRYLVSTNGVIYTAGAGASHFPGDIPGNAFTGGQYD